VVAVLPSVLLCAALMAALFAPSPVLHPAYWVNCLSSVLQTTIPWSTVAITAPFDVLAGAV
jgi:hypothetical protein